MPAFSLKLPLDKIITATGDDAACVELRTGGLNDVIFLLLLDGPAHPNPHWSWGERLIDDVIQIAQPAPPVTHIELLFPPSSEHKDMHFSTYIGAQAGFGKSFPNQRTFYMGDNAAQWRAVPLCAKDATMRVRAECEKHVDTKYSLMRYVFAIPPLRAISSLLPESTGSAAHCANLTARCLRNALPELGVQHNSNWYGPTTLALELVSEARERETRSAIEASTPVRSVGEDEEVARAVSTLLHDTDEKLKALPLQLVRHAITALSLRAVGEDLDDVAKRITQKQLATALLRYSCV